MIIAVNALPSKKDNAHKLKKDYVHSLLGQISTFQTRDHNPTIHTIFPLSQNASILGGGWWLFAAGSLR